MFNLVCEHFALNPAGEGEEARVSGEKPSMSLEIEEAYKSYRHSHIITSGWSVANLQTIPSISLELVRDYLINCLDKAFDGEVSGVISNSVHTNISQKVTSTMWSAILWEQCKYFYFVRAKCLPSQDTVKQPYRCIVCINRESGICYGAHCQCVSRNGEARHHVAALLFALEDFSSRGLQHPSGTAVTVTIANGASLPPKKWIQGHSLKFQ